MVTLEAILERNNLNRAYKQVKANKGGPGVDGMTVDELLDYLRAHSGEIVETVKAGKYKPQPVRRVMIPKEEKGKFRPLGIPTAVDRVIQQAIAQKLSDEYEPVFSLHSHGFRPMITLGSHQTPVHASRSAIALEEVVVAGNNISFCFMPWE